MKAAPEKMLQLMAYADGELSGAEKKEVEALLAKDPEAKQFVAEIMNLGELVKLGHSEKEIDVTEAVMAAVKEQPQAEKKSNVVSLADRRSRTKTGAIVIAALALAAGVVFYSRPKETPLTKAPTPVQAEPGSPDIVVEPADSPGQSVKVIYGPGTNEMTTSVIIWVDEERK